MPITIAGKPAQAQLSEWFKENSEVQFTCLNGEIHKGTISSLKLLGSQDALISLKGERFGFYLRNINSYTHTPDLETIFIPDDSNSKCKISLKVEDRVFFLDRVKLAERIGYFEALFNQCQNDVFDLSGKFSIKEVEALLEVANIGHSKSLGFEHAKAYLSAAKKISDDRLLINAEECIQNHFAKIQKEFFQALREENYPNLSALLEQGANINCKFGIHASNKENLFLTDCPDDTPLTYAVRIKNLKLIEFLLKNGASTKCIYEHKTPLMKACFDHSIPIVNLLIQYGANPNVGVSVTKFNSHTTYHPMQHVFSAIKDTLIEDAMIKKQKISAAELVKILLKNNYSARPNVIHSQLGHSKMILDLFSKLWISHDSTIDKAYTRGASIGFFNHKLPDDASALIGSFLGRKGVTPLACSFSASAQQAYREEAYEIQRLQKQSLREEYARQIKL